MGTLHFICGKAGAGKTTLARESGRTLPAVVICEDEWIETLGFEIRSHDDFEREASKWRTLMGPLASELLRLGVSVAPTGVILTRRHGAADSSSRSPSGGRSAQPPATGERLVLRARFLASAASCLTRNYWPYLTIPVARCSHLAFSSSRRRYHRSLHSRRHTIPFRGWRR